MDVTNRPISLCPAPEGNDGAQVGAMMIRVTALLLSPPEVLRDQNDVIGGMVWVLSEAVERG